MSQVFPVGFTTASELKDFSNSRAQKCKGNLRKKKENVNYINTRDTSANLLRINEQRSTDFIHNCMLGTVSEIGIYEIVPMALDLRHQCSFYPISFILANND